jgi:autotransporter-associated beta strand protein
MKVQIGSSPFPKTKSNQGLYSKANSKQTSCMKMFTSILTKPAALTLLVAALFSPSVFAQGTLYWDVNGATTGSGGPSPSGTWDGVTPNWNASSAGTGTTVDWVPGDIALFSAGTDATGNYTVTLSGTQTAKELYFNNGIAMLTNGTMALTGGGVIIVAAPPAKAIISSVISGSTGVIKEDTGELVLTATNIFTGNLTNQAGTLTLNNSAAASSGSIVFNGGLTANPAVLTSSNASMTIGNNISLISIASQAISVNAQANNTLTLSGVVSGTHAWSANGPGTLVLGATNTFAGAFTVQQGTVVVTADGALGTTGNGTLVTSGGTLALSGGFNYVTGEPVTLNGAGVGNNGALQGLNGQNYFGGSVTLSSDSTMGAQAGSELILGTPINSTGTANLTIANAGTVDLTGLNNVYSNTLVATGTLEVDYPANAGNGLVTVNAGASLTGSGSASGVNLSGSIAPFGEFSSGAQTWNGGGTYVWEIADAANPSANDLLSISSGLTNNATSLHPFTISVVSLNPNDNDLPGTPDNFDNTQQYDWTIASTAGIVGFATNDFTINASQFAASLGGGSFRLLVSGNNLVLEFDPAPVILCPSSIVQGNDLNDCSATVSFAAIATNYPNLSPVTILYQTNGVTITSPWVFPKGTTLVNATATDAVGDTAQCGFTVTVHDTQAPTVTVWPANATLDVGAQCNAAIPDLTVQIHASDNCDMPVYSQIPAAGTLVSLGVTNVLVTVSDLSGNSVSSNVTLTIIDTLSAPLATFVDAAYAGLPPGTVVTWPAVSGSGSHYIGCDAFATIQGGIDTVATSGTINVAAGTYVENVLLNKTATLLGPNGAIDPNTGTRVAEAIILPAAVQTSVQGSTSGVIIRVGSGSGHVNATISGFTLDGHNGGLSGGTNLNGVEIDTGAGIVNSTGSFDVNPGAFDTTMVVSNNIIRNLERYGVLVDAVPAATPNAGNEVSHNQIDNLPAGNNFGTPGGGRGRGVAFEVNTYGTCAFNVMTRVNVGWQDDNYYLPSPGAGTLVASNNISTYHRGIFHNLQYESATAATIEGNNIQVETSGDFPASSSNFGIELSSIQSAVGVTVSGNNVTNNVYGILLWNVPSTGLVIVSGGTVSGNQIGVWATSQDPQFGAAAASQSVISNVTVVAATTAGVEVDDSTATAATLLTVTGNTVVSGNPLGIYVNGAAASAIVISNNASITANAVGIDVNGGSALIQGNDLTGNTLAAISVANNGIVDAGNCGSGNVTGLGISTGGNNLSGYGFDNAAPWAILNGNAGSTPAVLASHDNFGAVAFDNIPAAFSDPNAAIVYSQTPAVLVPPTNVTVVCVSDVPAGATTLAGLAVQGGYYSANVATVSSMDNTVLTGSGVITRTYTVTDGCGVASTANQTITVSDTVPPVVRTQNITIQLDASGNASITPSQVDNGSSDNCAIFSYSVNPNTFDCANVGNNTVTLTVTDTSGNQASAMATVMVQDATPPTVVFNTITVQLDASGNYTLTPTDISTIAAGSSDACGIASTNVSPGSFTFCDVGPKSVALTLTDIHGNSFTTNANITVLAPVGAPPVVYVDASYGASCGAVPFPNSGGSGPYYIGYNAFKSVQSAVNAVTNTGTVNVAAGSYSESVTANKAVTLLGANQGVAGCASRGPESIISAGAGNAITVAANNVVVDGFDLTGAQGVQVVGYAGATIRNNVIGAAAAGVNAENIATSAANLVVENNCITLGYQVVSGTPTFGVLLVGVGGTQSPVIQDNGIQGAFYGYLLYGLNAAVPTEVQGGTVTGVLQGVAVVNLNPLTLSTYGPSTFNLNGISMSGFTGNWPALPNNNLQAGVYIYTGGSSPADNVTGTINNVTITGTGKISPDSSGLDFADFSTGAGVRQQITVQNSSISTNSNRGIFVSGANAVANVSGCTVLGNGFDPYGPEGNPGFGIIARNNSQVTVSQCFIGNPAVQNAYSVTALEADANTTPLGPTLVVNDCSIVNNGNGNLAGQDAGTLNASGNWWGSTSDTTIAALMTGTVDFTPYLDSGTDTDLVTAGFQGDFSTLHVTTLGAQTGVAERVQEGHDLASGASPTVIVQAGTYSESVVVSKSGFTLKSAQNAGVDARGARNAESVMNTNDPSGVIQIAANNVTVDGMSIGSAAVYGVQLTATANNAAVLNTLVTGASQSGIVLQHTSSSTAQQNLVQNAVTGITVGADATSGISVLNNTMTGGGVGVAVYGAATLKGNTASPMGNAVGVLVSGASALALLENNTLTGDTEAGIKVAGGATVDAGDCTDSHVTGLGTGSEPNGSSAGGNVLTGYGFDSAAPWAIENLNSGSPAVFAYQNSYGAVADNNLASLFTGNVLADQTGALLLQSPANLNFQCLSSVPAGATDLAGFVAQGGTVSATAASVSFNDSVVPSTPNNRVVTRTYTVTDTCGETANCVQTITVDDTIPPVVTVLHANLTLDVQGQCDVGVPDMTTNLTVSDNCGGYHITQIPPAGTQLSLGTTNVTVMVTDNSTNTVTITVVLNIIDSSPAPVATFVDVNYAGLSSGTVVKFPYGGSGTDHYIGCDAFPTVQAGINRVGVSGTVNVAAGRYVEDLTISQPLTLLGPNASVNPNTGTRAAEALLIPATSDPDPYDANSEIVVYVAANNVVIKGFTVDGDNTNLTSGVMVGTADVDAAEGIVSYEGVGSITLANNIVKNTTYTGFDFYNYNNGGTATTGNLITGNLFSNIGSTNFGFGIAVLIYNNFYADICSNVMSDVRLGVQTGNYSQANPGTAQYQNIRDNTIICGRIGIFHNLAYAGASPYTFSNNTITAWQMPNGGSYNSEWDGMVISSIQTSVAVTAISNTITASPSVVTISGNNNGYNVWNTPTAGTVAIEGGSVSNVSYGVWVNDYDGYSSPGISTRATVSNVNISTATIAGVYVQDDPRASTSGVAVQAIVNGNTVINGSGIGVLVQGTNAAASVLDNNASITGNGIGISVDTGVALIQNNDLTGNTLAGINVTNSAIVDAGNCTGVNVTRLGISTGGNNLSGYLTGSAKAIANGNPGGAPAVLASHDYFGAVAFDNIPGAFYDPYTGIVYSQTPAVLVAPTNLTFACASSVPAGVNSLAGLIAQGGYYSASSATSVSSTDNTVLTGNGVITRTYTVTDSCGVPSVANQTITVSNTTPPVVLTQNITIQLDATGHASITPLQVDNGSSANCAIASYSVNPNTFDCGNVGNINTVTLTVTDVSGNQASNTAVVTVQDVTPPAVVFNTISVQLDASGNYTLTPTDIGNIAAGSSDACGIASEIVSPGSFTVCDAGTKAVALTVTDVNGNPTTVNSTITVIAPVGPPTVVYVDASYGVSCGAVKFPNVTGTGTYYIGYNAFNTIQAGISAVGSGGTVNVAPGTYNEDLNIAKPLNLISSGGRNVTTINLQTSGSIYSDTILINASSVSVEGFTVTGFNATSGIDSDLASINFLLQPGVTSIEIADNNIQVGNISASSNNDDGKGVLTTTDEALPNADNINLNNNIFTVLPTIAESVIGSRAFYINPVVVNFTFASNTITGNLYHSTTEADNSLIEDNIVIGTGTADGSGGFGIYASDPPVNGNAIIKDNVITNTQDALLLFDSSNVVVENNVLDDNGTGVLLEDVAGGIDSSGDQILFNSLSNELSAGVDNEAAIGTPNVVSNWWGNVSGPTSVSSNPYGTGSAIVGSATIAPWLASGENFATGPGFQPSAPVLYPPTHLAFTTQPGSTNLNSPLSSQPVVQVEDVNNNLTPWANPEVADIIGFNPGNGVLTGTNPQLAAGGIATFTDLAITVGGGSGYTLMASAPSLISATSDPFNITNPPPVITSLNPFFARAGGNSFTLTVNGTGFADGSAVYWNGAFRSTTYVSGTELTAVVLGSDITSAGTEPVTVVSPAPGGGTSSSVTFTITPAVPTVVYVDTNYTGVALNTLVNWPYTGVVGTNIIGYDAFPTVQGGVNAVAVGGTVNVAAGHYIGEVTISQPLALLGPNAGVNPNTGTRVAEAVIQPDANDPEIYDPNALVMVSIAASHVTIKGLTIDGYNPELTYVSQQLRTFNYNEQVYVDVTVTGPYSSGTNLFNAAVGIGDYNGDSSIRIENNIVQNDAYAGVDLESDGSGSPPNTDSCIKGNLVENMDYNTEGYGTGISLYNNYYAEITDNDLLNVAIGISPQSYFLANPGDAKGQTISSNYVSASLLGIWLNLVYESASTFDISGNTSAFAPTNGSALWSSPEWDAVEITSIQSGVNVVATNNTIIGTNSPVGGYTTVGYNVWNTPTTGTVVIGGGSVSNANYGVWVNDYDGFQSPGGSTTATITGVTIAGASLAGVYVQDDPRASTNGVVVQATVAGNTVISGSGTGVLVQGTNAAASVLNNNASITGNGIGILVDTGVALIQNNDLTGNTVAAIKVINSATVDAGDCSDSDVTKLGTGSGAGGSSAGGNNLSGYLTGSPFAIVNGNPGGAPAVLAEHDYFGAASVSDNIPGAFNGVVDYSQFPQVIGNPPATNVDCVSEIPAGATSLAGLAGFIAQGGYYSANSATTVSYADSTNFTNLPFTGSGVITRTYTVADGCDAAVTTVQTITFSDTVPPVIVPLPNLTLSADPGECSKSNVTWVVVASDNCTMASTNSIPASGTTFEKGTTTVTTIATDTSGNTATNTFTVTVKDTQPPTVVTKNITLQLDMAGNGSITPSQVDNGSYDNCAITNLSVSPNSFTAANVGANTVTLTATDSSGNQASATAVVTVVYAYPPSLTCVPDVTVTVKQDREPYATGYPTATDPDGPVTFTYSDDVSGLTNCDATGNIFRTWTATDASSNVSTCVQTITLIDTNAPYFTYVPADITTTNDWGLCSAVVGYTPAAVDLGYFQGFENPNWVDNTNSANGDWDWNDYDSHIYRVPSGTGGIVSPNGVAYAVIDSTVPAAGPDYANSGVYTLFGGGTIPFASGYRVALDVYINFSDPEVASSTPTSGYGFDLDTDPQAFPNGGYGGQDFIFHVAAYSPTGIVVAADNNSSNTGTERPTGLLAYPNYGMLTNSGWYTFEWNFRETNGFLAVDMNVRSTNRALQFSQTLVDYTWAPDAITNIAGDPNYLWFNFIDDNKLPVANAVYQRIIPVESNPASPTTFPVGTTTVTSTATDECGNSTNTTFTVTVNDVEPPVILPLANLVQNNDPGLCGAVVTFPTLTATDNCAVASIVATPASESLFEVGTTTVTVVATDIHGNSATNSFTVTVNDTEPPVILPLANLVQNNDPGLTTAVVTFPTLTATDNCAVATIVATPASGSTFEVGTTTVTVVATDNHGNTATSTFTVTVIDAPVIVSILPASQTNNATTTASFTVVASGTVPFTYHWTKITPTATNILVDGGNISGSTSNVLTITNVLGADQAEYAVTVSNPAGSATTNGTLVVIDPVIFVQPVSVTNVLGSTVSFSVTAAGTAPLSYQWQQDGFDLPGETGSTLTLADAQDSDQGDYTVVVTNDVGEAISDIATLTLTHPPVIVTPPASQTVNQGVTVTFTVSVNGRSPFTYQWEKNGVDILSPSATTRTLVLNNVTTADDSNYEVAITNGDGGIISPPGILTVIAPPAITSQPAGLTNNAGTTASFSITASGTSPTYQWFKITATSTNALTDGGNVSGSISNVLTLTNVLGADSAYYYLVASNQAGVATSSNAILAVIDPIITSEPASLTVNLGSPASFSVVAYGTSPQYQWYKNGIGIIGANASTYAIASAADSDVAGYTVVVTNIYGTATSAPPATLTVIDPPVITSQPQSRTNNAGTTATFTVGYTGTAPGFQWYKGLTAIGGATTATLTLANVQDADAASYSVVLTNIIGTVTSSNATLTVIDAPVITGQPQSRTNNAGTTATFTVSYNGTAPSFQWYKGVAAIGGATTATLTLANVQDVDAASYSVVLTNAAGTVTSSNATLTVIDAPVITGQPQSRTNNAGTTATFTVVYTGTAPGFQWYKGLTGIGGATTATLTLANVQDVDAASYSVVLTNAAGTVTSSNATLTVIDAPVIVSILPASQTNNVTTTASFAVSASGTAPFTYQWTKITPTATNILADGGNISGSTNSVLTITDVLGADQAEYAVTVGNPAGSATTNGTLVVIDPAILVQPVGSTNFDGSTVSLSVTAAGTATLNYQWFQDGVPVYGATSSTLTLTDIADDAAGHYTVVVTNSVGSVTSTPALLVTVAPLITTQPVNVIVVQGQPASFSVSVNGQTPFTYQWLLNGTNVTDAIGTNRIYSLSHATNSTDAGNYQVVVSNPIGSQTSQVATLAVYATAAPTLAVLSYTNHQATVLLVGVPTFNYAIQGSSNLFDWVSLVTNTSTVMFTDTNRYDHQFYRGHYLP